MTQVKDFPERGVSDPPQSDDFLYLITAGNTDYNIPINSLLGRGLTKTIIEPLYTLVASDIYHTLRCTYVASKAITVPEDAQVSFAPGAAIRLRNAGSLTATIVPQTGGVVINTKSGLTIPPNGEVILVNVAADIWDASGDLTA